MNSFSRLAELSWRQAKRLVIIVIGLTVLLIGVAMIVLPGPAFIVIPAGLALLAGEFAWARWLLRQIKQKVAAGLSAVGFRPAEPKNPGEEGRRGDDQPIPPT